MSWKSVKNNEYRFSSARFSHLKTENFPLGRGKKSRGLGSGAITQSWLQLGLMLQCQNKNVGLFIFSECFTILNQNWNILDCLIPSMLNLIFFFQFVWFKKYLRSCFDVTVRLVSGPKPPAVSQQNLCHSSHATGSRTHGHPIWWLKVLGAELSGGDKQGNIAMVYTIFSLIKFKLKLV